MFRRSILELSCRRSAVRRIPRQITAQQIPSFLSSRGEFSTSSQQNTSPEGGSNGKPPESKSSLPKIVLGSTLAAGAALLAYQLGYLDQFIGKEKSSLYDSGKVGIDHKDVKETQHVGEPVVALISEEPDKLSRDAQQGTQEVETQTDIPHVEAEQKVETHVDLPHVEYKQKDETKTNDIPLIEAGQSVETKTDLPHHEASGETQGLNQAHVEEISSVTTEDGRVTVEEKHKLDFSQTNNSEGSRGIEIVESKTDREPNEGVEVPQVQTQVSTVSEESKPKKVPLHHVTTEDKAEVEVGQGTETVSLLEAYLLKEKAGQHTSTEGLVEQVLPSTIEELHDGYIMQDGKLVMDFLQAIHVAETRQAELDAQAFAEEKRALKEKYEKELRDVRARELMRAEEAAMLDKEIKREKARAAAAVRAIQEKMEEKLRMELEQKENDTEVKLKKFQELAKAELAAAISSEKAAQIEKMAEANLHINALCMAFYARSEEARQIHSVHKLALGALALEDALSKGLPIQQELDALNTYVEGIDKDSLLHLVLSTLPEETQYNGTYTLLQLNQKFNALKGTLRHYILIPPGGGGILAHALAQIASWLRMKDVDPSGDGIESVISRVEHFLAEGKLAEAADALQEGVRGSKAEEMAGDWVRQARNRAITEQALTVLQSYATCISLTQ